MRVIGVNLTGTFLCAHYALPHMLAQGRGAIINLASPHAFQTGKHIAAYAASKGGIVALTRQMALDYGGLGVRVNCVVPGAIDTPMLRADIQQGADWEANLHGWERNQPIGRLGQPADIAKVIVWLASDDAAFVLGARQRAASVQPVNPPAPTPLLPGRHIVREAWHLPDAVSIGVPLEAPA